MILKPHAPPSPKLIIFPKTLNQNFEEAVLFIVDEGSRSYVFEEDTLGPSGVRTNVESYAWVNLRFLQKGDHIYF